LKRITKNSSKNNKKRTRIIIICFLIALIALVVLLRVLPTVRRIDIIIDNKTSKFTKEDILSLSEINIGDKLYENRRSEIENKIEQNPYIKSAKIDRNLSGKVTITIEERIPSYMINYSGEYIYIDDEGYILEVNKENNNTTIIIGFETDFSGLSIGNTKIRLIQEDLEKLEVVNNIFNALESNGIENKITSIDVTDKKDFILRLEEEGKRVYIGDGSDLNTRVLYMKKILESESGNKGIIFVDSDLDEGYVYFREQE